MAPCHHDPSSWGVGQVRVGPYRNSKSVPSSKTYIKLKKCQSSTHAKLKCKAKQMHLLLFFKCAISSQSNHIEILLISLCTKAPETFFGMAAMPCHSLEIAFCFFGQIVSSFVWTLLVVITDNLVQLAQRVTRFLLGIITQSF